MKSVQITTYNKRFYTEMDSKFKLPYCHKYRIKYTIKIMDEDQYKKIERNLNEKTRKRLQSLVYESNN